MTILLNLDGVEAWTGGVLLPVGRHLCKIAAAEEGESANGNPQVRMQWEAVAGDCVGGTIRERLTITPGTQGKVRAFLEAVGAPIPAGDFALDVQRLVSLRATITIAERPSLDDPNKLFSEVVAHEPAPATATPGFAAPPTARNADVPF